MSCALLGVFVFGCQKDDVKTEIIDDIGVVPIVQELDSGIVPYQMFASSHGAILFQEGNPNILNLNQDYRVQASGSLNGEASWLRKRAITETASGKIFHAFSPTPRDQLLLEEIDPGGNNVALIMLKAGFKELRVLGLVALDENRFLIHLIHGNSGSQYSTDIYEYNLTSQELVLRYSNPEFLQFRAYDKSQDGGHWLMGYWSTKSSNQGPQGSVFYFDSSWNLVKEFKFSDMSTGTFYSSRLGLIRSGNNGEVNVFYPVQGSIPGQGVVYGLAYFRLNTAGEVLSKDFYLGLYGHEIYDIWYLDGTVNVLSKELNGYNLTNSVALTRFREDGSLVSSKFIRNSVNYTRFNALVELVDGKAKILSYDSKNKKLHLLSF